jgi:hypothetical protein
VCRYGSMEGNGHFARAERAREDIIGVPCGCTTYMYNISNTRADMISWQTVRDVGETRRRSGLGGEISYR